MTRSEVLSAAVRAVAEWRREAGCNPAEQQRRYQVQLRLEALIAEIIGFDTKHSVPSAEQQEPPINLESGIRS
jgi:hypothetical protein